MKKKNVINLIRYHTEENEVAFRNEAYEIANEFDRGGDSQLAEYIMALLSDANTFIPQATEGDLEFLERENSDTIPLPLPVVIEQDILGIVNAVSRSVGVNKFLFQGAPGTGKTETAKHIARILERELYTVDFSAVIDSKLGQTSRNIVALFNAINNFAHPERVAVLFDEIDSIILDRTDSNDLREMGRATSTFLKEMDRLDKRVVIIATTNLFQHFDKAIVRRFDAVIDFNRYTQEDLLEISEQILNTFLTRFKFGARNVRIFRKIMQQFDSIPFPGELSNMIRSAVAFSSTTDEFDYLKRIYMAVCKVKNIDIKLLQKQGFTVREIELLTGVSKSQVARELKEDGQR